MLLQTRTTFAPWRAVVRATIKALVLTLLLADVALAVDIDWVTVADAGNACDQQSNGCFGDVAYAYRISKFEVTVAQYTEFLNSVAASDPTGLYTSSSPIQRWGSSGSYSYRVISGGGNQPVEGVSFYDSLRFVNWLENGQPIGAQDSTTTEGGAYTFSGPTSVGARNPDASIFLTSEDEWYKAAYYDGVNSAYYNTPKGSPGLMVCTSDTTALNGANCGLIYSEPSDVGSYANADSAYGTFDQGGNLYEWTEAQVGTNRVIRGSGYSSPRNAMFATQRAAVDPTMKTPLGFRIAGVLSVPEPSAGTLIMLGLIALAGRGRFSRYAHA